jgi:DNA-binding HxlR family transcriptional regulator
LTKASRTSSSRDAAGAAAGSGGGGGPVDVAAAGAQPEADPLALALAEVGDRWALLIIDALMQGPRRFNDLQGQVRGIATNVLTSRLGQLEEREIVVASAYSDRPLRYSYQLTAAGRDLAGALRLLRSWGALRHAPASGDHLVEHAACGTALEPRWWCTTCDRVVDDDEGDAVRFL